MTRRILAIDPGVNGAIAWQDADGIIDANKMPEGMTSIVDRLRELRCEGVTHAVIEKVGTYMPGNSGPAAATFARHCGQLEAACYALGFVIEDVLPNKWMKALGGVPKDKQARKAYIKEQMARRYPHLRVTLATADALGILTFALLK